MELVVCCCISYISILMGQCTPSILHACGARAVTVLLKETWNQEQACHIPRRMFFYLVLHVRVHYKGFTGEHICGQRERVPPIGKTHKKGQKESQNSYTARLHQVPINIAAFTFISLISSAHSSTWGFLDEAQGRYYSSSVLTFRSVLPILAASSGV